MARASGDESKETESAAISSRQKLAMATIALSNFSVSLAATMWASFFPQEAASKGVTETATGFLFGATQLIVCIVSPVYGSLVPKAGPRYLCLSGLFLCSTCNFLLGTLNRCPNGISFTIMCLLCTAVDANGLAMLTTTSYSVVTASFPKHVNLALGILETCLGAASLIGPVVGGFLYSVGGYQLPFFFAGALQAASLLLSYFFFSSVDCHEQKESFVSLLKTPGATVGFLAVMSETLALTFLEPILSKRLLWIKPSISATVIGVVYMAQSMLYSISAPAAGWLCDKGYVKSLVLSGSVITALGLLLVGPSPLLPFLPRSDFWLTAASVGILGMGIGVAMLPTYQVILSSALNAGFSDGIATYGMAAGLLNSGWGLGAFLGPSLGGLVSERLGFEWATTICSMQCAVTVVLVILYNLITRLKHDQKDPTKKANKSVLHFSAQEKVLDEKMVLLPTSKAECQDAIIP